MTIFTVYFFFFHYGDSFEKESTESLLNKNFHFKGKIISEIRYYNNTALFSIKLDEISNSQGKTKRFYFWKPTIRSKMYFYGIHRKKIFEYDEKIQGNAVLKKDKYGNNFLSLNAKELLRTYENYGFRYKIKNFILERLEKVFQNKKIGKDFAIALLLGDRNYISRDVVEVFRNTGTMHVLAVSGLHIGLIVLFFSFVFCDKYLQFYYKNILLIMILLSYAYIVGYKSSVIRATIMIVCYLMSYYFVYKPKIYNIIGFALLMILLFDPLQVYSVGFQLSFLATFSIVFFYNKMDILLLKSNSFFSKQIGNKIIASLIVSYAAFLGTAPVLFYHFKMVNLFSILINIPIVMLFFFIALTNYTIFLLSLIPGFSFLVKLLAYLDEFLLQIVIFLLDKFDKVKLFYITNTQIFLITYAAMSLIVYLLNKKKKIIRYQEYN